MALTSVRRWCGSDVFINKLRAAILCRSCVVSGMFTEDPAVPAPKTLISLDAQNASVQFLLKWPTTNSHSHFWKCDKTFFLFDFLRRFTRLCRTLWVFVFLFLVFFLVLPFASAAEAFRLVETWCTAEEGGSTRAHLFFCLSFTFFFFFHETTWGPGLCPVSLLIPKHTTWTNIILAFCRLLWSLRIERRTLGSVLNTDWAQARAAASTQC